MLLELPSRRFLLIFCSLCFFLVAAASGAAVFFQERLIFPGWIPAGSGPKGPSPARNIPPETQSIFLEMADGAEVEVWVMEPQQSQLSSGLVAAVFNGNGSRIEHSHGVMQMFSQLGVSSVALEYRGFGRSSGRPTEVDIYSDIDELWSFMLKRFPMLSGESLIVYGNSLGGGPATYLAEKVGAKAAVLVANFTSIPDVARTKNFVYALVTPFIRHTFPVAERVEAFSGRCIVLAHGKRDRIVPYSNFERLRALAEKDNRVVALVEPKLGHNLFPRIEGKIREAVQECLKRHEVR